MERRRLDEPLFVRHFLLEVLRCEGGRCRYRNTPESFQRQEVPVTRYNRLCLTRDRGLEHPVIGGIAFDRIDLFGWIDQVLGLMQPCQDLGQKWVPGDWMKFVIPKNRRQFSQQIR